MLWPHSDRRCCSPRRWRQKPGYEKSNKTVPTPCFNYVVSYLNKAIPIYRLHRMPAGESGRITATIAPGCQGGVLASAASPLFNRQSDYAPFKGKEGKNLFSTTRNPQKWRGRADACKAAIDARQRSGVKLYEFCTQGNMLICRILTKKTACHPGSS